MKYTIQKIRIRRKRRIRARIAGVSDRPRLSVFRSNQGIYAQLIDDREGRTLIAASSREVKAGDKAKKTDKAFSVGELLAKRAKEAGVEKAVFDRGAYKFHGRVKAVAEGAKKAGLEV